MTRLSPASPFANAKAVMLAQLASNLLWLATVSLLTHSMLHADLGSFLYLFALAAGLEAFTDAGLRFTVVTRLAASGAPGESNSIFWSAVTAKLVLSIMVASVVLLLAAIGVVRADFAPLLVLTILVLVSLPSSNPLVWAIRSMNLQWFEGVSLVVYRVTVLACVLLVPNSVLTAEFVMGSILAANLLFAAILFGPLRPFYALPRLRDCQELLRSAWHSFRNSFAYGASLIATQLGARYWVLLLGYSGLSADLIAMSTSQMVIQSVLMFGVALGSSYLPYLGRYAHATGENFALVAKSLLFASFGTGLAFAAGVYVAAPAIMGLVFDQTGEIPVFYLSSLCVLAPVILTSFIARFILSAKEKGRIELMSVVSGLGPAIILAPIVMREFGTIGLISTYIGGELIVLFVKLVAVYKEVRFRLSELAKPVMMLTAIILVLTSSTVIELDRGGVLWIVIGGVTSALTLATFMTLHWDEISPIWKITRK